MSRGHTSTWLDACHRFAAEHGVATDVVELLHAFVSPWPRTGTGANSQGRPAEMPWTKGFAALERALVHGEPDPVGRIADDLSVEVDIDQAAMFQRRCQAVDGFLAEIGDAPARLLRVGLRHRLAGMLAAPRPHAIRVRAVADFYYSHGSRHHHRRRAVAHQPLAVLVAGLQWREVTAGIERATLDGMTPGGPTHVNLLRVDPRRVDIRAVDARAAVERGEPFADFATRRGAIAATSGGFFLYSEPDIELPSRRYDPVGLLVSNGRVLSGPVFRRGAVVVTADGAVSIEAIGAVGQRIGPADGERSWTIDAVTHRAHEVAGPDVPSFCVVADTVVDVGRRLRPPLCGLVTSLPTGVALRPGDRVRWGPIHTGDGRVVREAIAGGPMLVVDRRVAIDLHAEDFWGTAPPVTFSQDETGDHNLLPRLAAGLDDHDRLVLAAVDGRNLERALGMTLHEVAELMIMLGCHTATNLDGGSSKRMVVAGETLDLPSTEILAATAASSSPAIRPVHTALLFCERRRDITLDARP